MKKISKQTSLKELALIVCDCLKQDKIDAVLTGGAVVSIYTSNKYQSFDLDFISYASSEKITASLAKIGFKKMKGRYYCHSQSDFFVEFPSGPISIGNKPIKKFNEISTEDGFLKLLTPTHCVMDRLAAYYYWNDQESFDQAIMVARNYEIDIEEIKAWSEEEQMVVKFDFFLKNIA